MLAEPEPPLMLTGASSSELRAVLTAHSHYAALGALVCVCTYSTADELNINT